MSKLIQFVDNRNQSLGDVLREVAANPVYKDLSIVTGYWDMIGTSKIIDLIKDYRSVRILIGAEPFSRRSLKLTNLYRDFPDADIAEDLRELSEFPEEELVRYRETARILATMIHEGRLQVRICRKPFIHAKEYVFGSYDTVNAVGIIGSSNFTGRGLSDIATGGNAELNYLEDKESTVLYSPRIEGQQYGHLSWFDMMWNLPEVEEWTGDFQEILSSSPVGNKTYGPYDAYIKALMRLFPDEISPTLEETDDNDADVLYSYQRRNAGILLNKLNKMGTAILADSVGLGKTVTAGAIINHFRKNGKKNIAIIPPAKLKGQWRDDLQGFFGLDESNYSLISQQDIQAILRLRDAYHRSYPADLIVIDEAHNLRNEHSERFKAILELIEDNPKAKVLLLTATPINNGFKDLVSELELGLGGRMQSGIMVSYQDPNGSYVASQDFFDFLKDLDGKKKTAEGKGERFDWDAYRQPLSQGISHFIVRSTRQGVQEEARLISDGNEPDMRFPDNAFVTIDYAFSPQAARVVESAIEHHAAAFEGIDPLAVNDDELSAETQRLNHPLDIIAQDAERFHRVKKSSPSLVKNVFSLVSLLGFPIYRSQLYSRAYRNTSVAEIGLLDLSSDNFIQLRSAMTIHNILQTLWLKRLESSLWALQLSVERYRHHLNRFVDCLEKGYVVESSALSLLESDEEEQFRLSFWDEPVKDFEEELTGRGIPYVKANEDIFDVPGLLRDVKRDQRITAVILAALKACIEDGLDSKLDAFAEQFSEALHEGRFGRKVLVFSAYADTIDYLRAALPSRLRDTVPDFGQKAAFLTASSSDLNNVVGRFSPVSKKRILSKSDEELNYLFSTDVLSEGQNLQDAAILINYDLHWNPVRMVQRNGRVNRLGSRFSQVLIGNMAPAEDLDYYLGLIDRLQGKIDTIKNSIGTDQGVLTVEDENPIEYIQDLYSGDDARIREVIDAVDADNDVLSWRNAHVYALREFLQHATQQDLDRINAMPRGKWNYLPSDSRLRKSVVLMCEQIGGIGNGMNYRFVRVETGTRPLAEPITNEDALDLLRTSPDDNAGKMDNVQLDRSAIEKLALSMVGMRRPSAGSGKFKPKKSEEELLGLLQKQLDIKYLRKALGPVQSLVQVKRRYDALMGRLRKESQKVDGFVSLEISEQLLSDWRAFLKDINQNNADEGGKWRPVMAGMSIEL